MGRFYIFPLYLSKVESRKVKVKYMNLKKYNVTKKSIKKSSSEDLIVLIAVMARNIMNISVELKKRQTSKELQLSKVPDDFSEGPDFSKLNFVSI